MIPWPDPPIIAAIIGAGGLAFGAWLTWLASGASRLSARIETLETRMAKVESENDTLRGEKNDLLILVSAMASFINRVGVWVTAGTDKKRKPKPSPQIAAHIDAEPWMPDPEDVRG